MAQLINAWIKKETLETLLDGVNRKGDKGVALTISVNNETKGDYGQNVNGYVSQTKEQRESGKPKFYVLNGNTVWSSDGEPVFTKDSQKAFAATPTNTAIPASVDGKDDLPF